jgi:hypothetical protein
MLALLVGACFLIARLSGSAGLRITSRGRFSSATSTVSRSC